MNINQSIHPGFQYVYNTLFNSRRYDWIPCMPLVRQSNSPTVRYSEIGLNPSCMPQGKALALGGLEASMEGRGIGVVGKPWPWMTFIYYFTLSE